MFKEHTARKSRESFIGYSRQTTAVCRKNGGYRRRFGIYVISAILLTSCGKKKGDSGGDGDSPAPAVAAVTVQPGASTASGAAVAPSPVSAVVVANAAPFAANLGVLSVSAVMADKVSLSWGKAVDDKTPQSRLKYIVYLSPSNNVSSVDDAEANGAAFGGYSYDSSSKAISGLSPLTTYFVNVLVKDELGRQTPYKAASFTTTSFPVPGGGGAVTATAVGADVKVDWTMGLSGLSYRLYYSLQDNINDVESAMVNGTGVGPDFTADIASETVVTPGPSKRLFLTVLVRNAGGNIAAYSPTSFDTDAEVFIAYIHFTRRDLLYVKRLMGEPWSSPIDVDVGATQVYAYPPSLAVNAAGEASIAYHLSNDGATNVYDLAYAKEGSGGLFNIETVASIGSIGLYPGLALKSDGSPGIVAYATDVGSDMYYFETINGLWSMQAAYSVGANLVGYFNAMVYDRDDKVHACTHNQTTGDVYYVTNKTGSWVGELVDGAQDVGDYCDIAIDSAGKIHLSYYNTTTLDLDYATNASGSWVVTVVDSAGSTGTFTSIDVDAGGFAHISYYNTTLTDVYYATNKSGAWITTKVDNTSLTTGSQGTSLKLDALGRPHIAYYDGTHKTLRYAFRATDVSPWSIVTVESDGANATGYYPSIDVK